MYQVNCFRHQLSSRTVRNETNMITGETLKVYVADRSPAVLERLSAIFAEIPGVAVVGKFSNLEGALDSLPQLDPEVVIMDAYLAGGIEILRSIKRQKPATVVVMLTDLHHPQYRNRFDLAGADIVRDVSNEFNGLGELLREIVGKRGDGSHKRSQHQLSST
jgi:DNA-binding NarL/FixJ family response regulator